MKVHLIGIGGVGMAGLAVLLKRRGHDVTGCDLKSTARTRGLESLGIPVAIGHDARHVEGQDLVIVTPAVAPDNPEYLAASGRSRPAGGPDSSPSAGPAPRADRLRCLRRGSVLAKLVSDAPDSIAVCGSHGKTTTATFIAKLLLALGEPVEWAIGGETGDFPVAGCADAPFCARPHAQHGETIVSETGVPEDRRTTAGRSQVPPVLVVEADESDGTLAEYAAKTLVVTNCDYDHADHFKTRADYIACYDAARAKAREVVEGTLPVGAFLRNAPNEDDRQSQKRCLSEKCTHGAIELALAALAPHNRANALMAVEVARRRGHASAAIAAALPGVVAELPDRRFQRVWPVSEGERSRDASRETRAETRDARPETSRLTPPVSCPQPLVYTDYAHHPAEMACAVKMAREKCAGTLRVLFQPHRYSRTKALKDEFPAAFAGADEVVLCPTYAAFEEPVEGGDVADLYAACRSRSGSTYKGSDPLYVAAPRFFLARSCAEAWEHARNSMKPGDLTLLLGAGDIIDLVPQVRAELRGCISPKCNEGDEVPCSAHFGEMRPREGANPREPLRIWIGAGSNTWKSDLNLSVEYVKTTGPAGRSGASLLADPAIGPRIPWMAGIPGTVGGWIKMNAGAFGHSISEVIAEVKVDGRWIPAAACGFSYRHSDIAGEIQDVRFAGSDDSPVGAFLRNAPNEGDRQSQKRCLSENCAHGAGAEQSPAPADYLARRRKFPPGTKGSVFKNPPGDFAGRLLEAVGAKGLRVGGASVWDGHANVIVAGADATASDFLALARLMAARVRFRFGVRLAPEVAGLAVD